MNESTRSGRDPLDEALASLPEDVTPERDLWPQIRAEIAQTPIVAQAPASPVQSTWFRLAAAILLVVVTSFVTYSLTRQSMPQQVATTTTEPLPAPQVSAQPASFGNQSLGAGYMNARADLDKRFQARLATLPPADRAKIERNLADIRHAADEISTTLKQHPSDPLLQDLLMSTYQSELQLLANVSDLPTAGSMRTDL
ncbi:MAG TPA: hypothetical protein VJS12_09065 [Steroidobacteraceae bacterium]|nr:hypothetical protein [Steroidobacteraceae bacterium]